MDPDQYPCGGVDMFDFKRLFVGILMVLLLSWPAGALAQGKGPIAAKLTIAEDGSLHLSAADRCPVCGMYPAKRPKSAAGMVLGDGRCFYFCGNGCLLRTYHRPRQYLDVDVEDIHRMVVKDYFTGAPLDARDAWWVAGSDVVGPMGPALVALNSEQAVSSFQARHGGKLVFRLNQMDETLWQRILPPKH